jgi:hypothetical protein
MRLVLIAALAVVALPLSGHCQSRPAPETLAPEAMGETAIIRERVASQPASMVNALRVMVITSGIIGGFVAADVMSGGLLTAPLLAGGAGLAADMAAGGARVASLRPVIVPLAEKPAVTGAIAREVARKAQAATAAYARVAPAAAAMAARW